MTARRVSRIAGTWYPGDRRELESLVDRAVADAEPADVAGRLVALVVPHAGIIYSGRIAAAGFRLLQSRDFDAVVVLGPYHRGCDGVVVMEGGAIETPLGAVRLDEELAEAFLESDPLFGTARAEHEEEHSVEVQFPFLRRFVADVPVVPLLMGYQTPETVAAASHAMQSIAERSEKNVLLIASSDLSHYHRRADARQLDEQVVRCLEQFDVPALERLLTSNHRHACGGGPMIAVLSAARALGASEAQVLAYGDSGDVNGDTEGVVGYVSAAFTAATP